MNRQRKKQTDIEEIIQLQSHKKNCFKHFCKLNEVPEANYEYFQLPERANYFTLLWCKLKVSLLISTNYKRTFLYYSSKANIQFERWRQVRSGKTYIIHPFSDFRLYWEIIMILFYGILFIIIPARLTFYHCTIYHKNSTFLQYFDMWGFADILINFVTGYYDNSQKTTVLEPSKIAVRYVKNHFITDCIASLPTVWINLIYPEELNYCTLRYIFAFSSVFRFLRYKTFLRYVITLRITDNPKLYKCISLIISYILFLHWCTCCLGITKKFLEKINSSDILIEDIDNLLMKALIEYVEDFSILLDFFNFSTDIPAEKYSEILLVEFLIISLITTIFTAYAIAQMLEIINYKLEPEINYLKHFSEIKIYLSTNKICKSVQQKVEEYFPMRYNGKLYKEDIIHTTFTENIRNDLFLSASQKFISKVKLFAGIPNYVMIEIISKLTVDMYFENDVVVKAGYSGNCMYFISTGTVALYSTDGKEVCHLEDGDYFGELSLISDEASRKATVIACTTCEMFVLDRKDFLTTLSLDINLKTRVFKLAAEKLEPKFKK